jgi:hypothetical protein
MGGVQMHKILICQKTLEEIKKKISSPLFTDTFRLGNHFTRSRKLKMKQVIYYLFYSSKASMNLNISNIRDDIPKIKFPNVTKQAVSKARKGIDPKLFKDLYYFSVKTYYKLCKQRKTWKGFHLFAIDGSCIQVPKSKDNIEYFGLCKNKFHSREDAMARVSLLYDLLEDIVVDGSVNDYRYAERSSAQKHLEYLETAGLANRAILLFDRGYPSYDFFKRIAEKEYHYLMRIQGNVKSLTELDCNDEITNYTPIQRKGDEPVKVRVVHVTLDDGTDECLVTNLTDPSITPEMLKELYFLRWGIESKYFELKNQLELEEFSGSHHLSVEQDFFINLLFMNLCSLIKSESDNCITRELKNKKNKFQYQANRAYIIGRLKKYLVLMLCGTKQIVSALNQLLEEAIKRRSQIQPNRKCKRPRIQLRHRHLNNRKTCM